ncbi:MAG: hypothetical protein INF91_09790 [Alphaproteobacteria bacterium]|nr:hypothetical protein [Alphaproteobacteria bacterium]
MSADALSAELRQLHRMLLVAEAEAHGLSRDPYKMMGAAMSDARLAWLMPMLKTIAAFDADAEADALAASAMQAEWAQRIESLLGGPELASHREASAQVAALLESIEARLAGWR